MTYSNLARSTLLAGLLVGLGGLQPAHAQGVGKATMSVGITIVAPDAVQPGHEAPAAPQRRIPVDPAYAIRSADPLRDARVERLVLDDGRAMKVVSY